MSPFLDSENKKISLFPLQNLAKPCKIRNPGATKLNRKGRNNSHGRYRTSLRWSSRD